MSSNEPAGPFNVLFLCTGNSARSILAECVMNRLGRGKFRAYSAGSMPKGEVHPQAVKLLSSLGYDTGALRSKSWEEFSAPGARELDFVITVCDNAASEICPYWPGQPISSHWGMPDPAGVEGSDTEVALAFADTYRMLSNRIGIFASLPIAKLDRLSLKQSMDEIGKSSDPAHSAEA
ncbi:MAG TPA: arsenate reductase ArsC [Caulobacteraceae bacterium]|jgi:protein-tyrosine-phosphatase|nr:arsenate reductase ArsC [Caulobacteraceae bacterium]